ncbi:MAG: hypothetical protein WC595_03535 [Candidatus Nanoarchaeia archaeon]
MEKRQLISGEQFLTIETDSNTVLELCDQSPYLRHVVPKLEVSSITADLPASVTLQTGDVAEYRIDPAQIRITAPYDSISEGQTCFLLYHLLQREFLKSRIYVVHAAALVKNDNSILLIGSPKSGKTSLSLELALERGFTLYGDDAIKLNFSDPSHIQISGGNQFVGYKKRHIEHPTIRSHYPQTLPRYLDTAKLGISQTSPTALTTVVFLEPDLFDSNKSSCLPPELGKILFYEAVSREMRSAGYCLVRASLPLPSLDRAQESTYFLNCLQKQNFRFSTLTGNFDKMVNHLEDLIHGK